MPPLRLLADNYTSRGYKELGRSELKAPKISPQRGKGPATLLFRTSKRAGFSATAERKGNERGEEKGREEKGPLAVTAAQLHASSKIVFNEGP